MAGGAIARQQPRRGEDQRTGSYGSHIGGARRLPAQEIQHLVVGHQVDLPRSARYEQDVGLRRVRQRHGRQQSQAAAVGDGFASLPGEMRLEFGKAREHLVEKVSEHGLEDEFPPSQVDGVAES